MRTSGYKWNGFGDLVQSTDADNHVATLIPDPLGRTQQTTTPDGLTIYNWDTAANGIGRIGSSTSPDNIDCTYSYDGAGRPNGQSWTLRTGNTAVDGTYALGISYDSVGRSSIVTYPSVGGGAPVQIQRTYFPNGTLSSLVRVSTGQPIWTVNSRNPRNQVSQETAANNVGTSHGYDQATGLIHEIKSTLGTQTIRDLLYAYDPGRRLQQRTIDGQVERFSYDMLNRLTSWEQGNASTNPGVTYSYDDLGNMLARSNTTFTNHLPGSAVTGQVTFTPGDGVTHGPHQIAASSLGTYGYDARGDQMTAPGRTTTFAYFGLPHTMTVNGVSTTFAYDGSRSRVLKTSGATAVVSFGGLYERRVTATQTTDVLYAMDEGRPVAQITFTETATGSTEQPTLYLHGDHLGSVQMVTNPAGQITARQTFDPFGGRVGAAATGVRVGFDGLEEDDDLSLVNMNGRIYDPLQSRFVSADPLVSSFFVSQSFNPYSFVQNNPLNLRDPSGFYVDAPEPDEEGPSSSAGSSGETSSSEQLEAIAGAAEGASEGNAAASASAATSSAAAAAAANNGGSALGAAAGAAAAAASAATSSAATGVGGAASAASQAAGAGSSQGAMAAPGSSAGSAGGGASPVTPGSSDGNGTQSPSAGQNQGGGAGGPNPAVTGALTVGGMISSGFGGIAGAVNMAFARAATWLGSYTTTPGELVGLSEAEQGWMPLAAGARAVGQAASAMGLVIGIAQGVYTSVNGDVLGGFRQAATSLVATVIAATAGAGAAAATAAVYGAELGGAGGPFSMAVGAAVGAVVGMAITIAVNIKTN